jgi:sulfur carrier protein ThiS
MEKCHLVLVNGIFVSPSARANTRIGEGDTLAVWPPVAGG